MEDADNAPDTVIPVVVGKDMPEGWKRPHKVAACGWTSLHEGEVLDAYRFQYAPVAATPDDLHPGVIPAGFSASVPADDTFLWLHTREEPDNALFPEYRIAFSTAENVLVDWTADVDSMWMATLQALEEHAQLAEETLDYLDADPLWLFGIADPATQRQLEKAAHIPVLKCLGTKPSHSEWYAYLGADQEMDHEFSWVVEAFAQVELPNPWGSYKGVGDVVCFLNEETNETSWKHPFYEYFAQLMDHCRRATKEEHVKLRINRMMWSYEAECADSIDRQQPLLSPKYVDQMAQILNIDVSKEPFMVRTMKTFLKAFCLQYRLDTELSEQEIKWCLEIIESERVKAQIYADMRDEVAVPELDPLAPGVHAQVYCAECGQIATSYCVECGDSLCEECYPRLHAKGHRASHEQNFFIPCSLCKVFVAKLQCTYTFGNFCLDCYARKHVKTLPRFLDLKPVKIDYTRSGGPKAMANAPTPRRDHADTKPSGLGEDWHAFYDLRGIRYFYNFKTKESTRGNTLPDTAPQPRDAKKVDDSLIALAQVKGGRQLVQFGGKLSEDEYRALRKSQGSSGGKALKRSNTQRSAQSITSR